jgi:tol-pal system protein YbgF
VKHLVKKLVVLFPLLLVFCPTVQPASKEIIRLQADVTLLQQQMRDLQKSFDTQGAVLKTLVEQLHDQIAALRKNIEDVRDANQQTQAAVSAKVESITGQFSTVNSSLDLVLDKIARLSQQMAEAKAKAEALDTVNTAAGAPSRSAPPSPAQLYDSSYGDYIKGNYDLARQGFEEYVKTYPDTELSDNAQYWIGECYYVQRKFPDAIGAFEKVIELYPKGDKAPAASLKKAYSLLEGKNNEAGIRELRTLMQRYPNSDSAQLARERLTALGAGSKTQPQASRKTVRH